VHELTGVAVSHGIAIGRALVMGRWELDVPHYNIQAGDARGELRRFLRARNRAREEITALRDKTESTLGTKYAAIFDAHLLMLEDRELGHETMLRVRERMMNVEWALAASVHEMLATLQTVDDPYIRERGGDLADVHRRLQRILAGEENRHDRQLELEEDTVVVAHSLNPSDAAWLHQPHIVGFVTEEGSRTSHTAIIASALEIPAVVGVKQASSLARDGELVVVDGSSGRVVLGPGEREIDRARSDRERRREHDRVLEKFRGPVVTADGIQLKIAANIEFPEEMETVNRVGADGVGLYRTEFLFLTTSPLLPTEQEHFEAYSRIAEAARGERVVIRTLDLGGEKYFQRVLDSREPNPVLGMRAVRLCLARPAVFRTQLRGLLRAAAEHANIWILVPMISGLEEWREVRSFVADVRAELRAEGVAVPDVPVGPMVEVPSAALVVEHLAAEADFLSIGTNDLVQYLIAADRGNLAVSHLSDPWHPAVLNLVRRVIEAADHASIPVSLCGEVASDPLGALTLLGLGLRWFSCGSIAVAEVRTVLRSASCADAREAVDECLGFATGSEVRRHLTSRLAGVIDDALRAGADSRVGSD
jgi:phosphotransferase system enzyme I (PtsI)